MLLGLISTFLFLGDGYDRKISLLMPLPSDSVSYEQGKIFLVSVDKQSYDSIILSTQWEKIKVFDFQEDGSRINFAKEFYKLFEPKTTIQLMTYSYKYFKGYTNPESLAFSYYDAMTIRGIWQRPEFAGLAKKIQQSSDISDVLITLKGWKDSTHTTVYDDPNTDGRSLYKIHTSLIPGENTIYCGPAGKRNEAVAYSFKLVMESKPIADRTDRFHNSTLEQSCATCHEGLPSSDEGATMKADCNVCHKSMSEGATFLHAPAEMKECATCHSWSAEQKSVVVEKGVPAVCYDCHSEKQAQVENAVFPHPVAGDCLTCHSPHGTNQKHIVKSDVYTLCTGCHEEQKINHPVGRHPLRFVQVTKDFEISCISCHNPHGSANESMLHVPGGRMGICEQCH